jgi:hypothetical protein
MPAPYRSSSARASSRRARAILLTGAVLVALVVREGWRETSKARTQRGAIDERFASFVAPARGARRIGSIVEGGSAGDVEARRVELEYALAPTVVSPGTAGTRLVVVSAPSVEAVDRVAAAHRLRPVARTADGCALCEKTSP